MFSADDFFNLLSQRKRALDRAPIFSPDELLTLESAYRVIHDLTDNARSPSSRRRRARVRLRLRIIRSLGAVLFVLVGVSVSVTDLASPKHDDIFPRLEHWWRNNPPSQQFADRAVELLHALDERRVRGDLEKRKTFGRTFTKPRRGQPQHSREETTSTADQPAAFQTGDPS